MAQKPSIPKGTRDFSPQEMMRRNYIFDNIKNVFKKYGFLPIETPAMENLETLLGKYGEEGDKLLFKILNSGNYLSNLDNANLTDKNYIKLTNQISEKGLRYDLTVPFARFVVQYRDTITFPFKRYQIQPVWRADKPQKGRYREFYQCDVDVIGSDSLINEVELIQIIDEIFTKFGIAATIKLNNRKILAGIAEEINQPDKLVEITVAIDKLAKIGLDKVNQELKEKGLTDEAIFKLQPIINFTGNNEDKILKISELISTHPIGITGINEISKIFSYVNELNLKTKVEFDLTLARGLNYYTGAIFEVKANDIEIGSICGGGRYDNLTGIFGLSGVSGVGISFGADRIFDVMNQLNLFPVNNASTTQVLFVNFGEKEERYCLQIVSKIRAAGINSEIFPDLAKMKKQMSYADKKCIPFVALVGDEEIQKGLINLKNMKTGTQKLVDIYELITIISEN